MNILTTGMMGASVYRTKGNEAWVYQSPKQTGLRWCYLFLRDADVLICCMTGNPVDENFKILEDFRKATEAELQLLDYMELMTKRSETKGSRWLRGVRPRPPKSS